MSNGQAFQLSLHDRLVLTTLGRASLECVSEAGSRHELLSAGKPLGLVVYLACSPGHSASREHLMDLLWADLDVEAARHSVRQAVWFLRQRLGDHAIAASDGSVELCVPLESDRDAFLEAIERVEFERALDLYGGDFLPGFAAPGGADFEQWADLERFRLRRMFRRAGETVVRDWMTRGRLRKAKDLAVRLRANDPDDESGWRLELETLLAANDRVGAELAAHRLEDVLARAGRPPEPATAGLLALVRQAAPEDPATASKQPLTTELIGREREFAAILAAWGAARDGLGQHLHITGAAGLGKSRLLADVHARLRSMGGRVVVVRANPGERSVPYALASELALALAHLPGAAAVAPDSAAALVALNPTLSSCYGVAPDHAFDLEALRRRTIALGELLRAVAEEHPVALLIDDVHWTDDASRQILNRLLSLALKHAVLVVTAARPGIPGVVGRVSVEPFALEPLTVDMIGALLASLGRLPAEPWATRFPGALHAPTAGTPLLVLETLYLLLEQGVLTLADGAWSCRDGAELDAMLAQGWPLRRRLAALSRRESWLLVLLATAGAPLPADVLARAAGRDRDAVQADLLGLDVRGLVARDGSEWQPAHDEIAARALEGAAPGARRAANAILGRLLVATGRDDPGILQRAGRHLAAAGEDQELTRVFRRRLLLQRRRGERRSPTALASDLLGQEATSARVKDLVRMLPLHIRLGLISPPRVAAAILGGLLLASGVSFPLWRPAPPLPDAVLVAFPATSENSITAWAAPLKRAGWERNGPIRPHPYSALAAAGGRNDHAASPDGSSWAFSRVVEDSGEIELFVVGPDGQPRRLTFAPGDDGGPTWSPDGRFLAFATNRWNIAARRSDIAVLELASGRIHRVTNVGTASSAKWSPDGTRIAYTVQNDSLQTSLCWISPDGQIGACPAAFESAWIVGWSDDRHVLVALDSDTTHVIEQVDLDTKQVTVAASETVGIQGSPDGRWITCYCVRPGFSDRQWLVYPTDAPEMARPLRTTLEDKGVVIAWTLPRRPANYLDTLGITASSDTIQVGVPHQLRARGFDVAGSPAPLHALMWRSDDDAIATIEPSTGILHPHHDGTVRIVASAGGWRDAERRFVVRALTPSTVLRETWHDSIGVRWVPFGDPMPAIVSGPDGRPAFWNHGDGHFLSGVYSRDEFGVARGLAIDVELSTPVIGPRQQDVVLSLGTFDNRVALERWNHRIGQPPGLTEVCVFQYAAGGGDQPSNRKRYGFGAQTFPAPPQVTSGSWYEVRIQIFPDGRCGLAVNGTPITIAADPLTVDRRYRLLVWGNSLGNRMLVGPVTLWEGVPNDVDWGALRPGATPRPTPSPPSSRLAASPTGSPHTGPSRRIPRRPR